MIVFTVHEPPNSPADRLDRAEAIVFVRDGFSLLAMILGPWWLLLRGLWLAAAVVIIVAGATGVLLHLAGVQPVWSAALLAALHLIIGFEGRNIERWTLARRGWNQLGSVTGRDTEECERRFFEAWMPGQPFIEHKGLSGGGRDMAATGMERPRERSLMRRLMGKT